MASETIFLDESSLQPIIPDLSDVHVLDSSRESFEDSKMNVFLDDITNSLDKSKISIRKSLDEQDTTTYRSTPYELERKAQTRRNTDFLRKLGIDVKEAVHSMVVVEEMPVKKKKKNSNGDPTYNAIKKRKFMQGEEIPLTPEAPSRFSKRVRGEQAPSDDQLIAEITKEIAVEASKNEQEASEKINYSDTLWKGRPYKRALLKLAERLLPSTIIPPFTLGSIGTTILSAGTVKKGTDEKLYWSSTGALHKHRYPIGYKASKDYFGRTYIMEIKEGKPGRGPLFEVRDENGSQCFQGTSPTAPWTEVCVKSKSPGTRVSGPLFFGFSDPLVMKMIKQLDEAESTS